MDFGSIDAYLLDGEPRKAELVEALLAAPPDDSAVRPFYEGMRLLGARTPDLALIALRLVLSGKKATDEDVSALRELVDRARAGGESGNRARIAYHEYLE